MRFRKANRCTKNASSVVSSLGIAGLLLAGLCMGLAYWWCDSACTRVSDEISVCEKEMEKLKTECQREAARWDELKAKNKLSERLTRWGLEMDHAHVSQVVRFDRKGRIQPNATFARLRRRAENSATAMATLTRPVMPQTMREAAPSTRASSASRKASAAVSRPAPTTRTLQAAATVRPAASAASSRASSTRVASTRTSTATARRRSATTRP